ncbi:DUF4902 domain-containing protein [Burkholderia alba]|uniref:DUF4902 domain-containing protein n=1 Tax=Burkholderia alba TaxID=2683677 RepID=UPI002B0624DA|nr:DUF4902 domain-containing protein [Burkholderia alba]
MDLKPARVTASAHAGSSASFDGYVRIPASRLALANLSLLCAGSDENTLADAWDIGLPACHAGYCEWIDTQWRPPITFGWCWFVDPQRVYRMLPHSVTGNVMIVCTKGYDLGPADTARYLEAWIRTLSWSASVSAHVALPDL